MSASKRGIILRIELFTVNDIPMIREGDDLAAIICNNTSLKDKDIVVIASTIIAKAEGRIFSLKDIVPGRRAIRIGHRCGRDPAFVQAVLDRSVECLVESPFILVQLESGQICVNAGIDDSNIEDGLFLDLPEDPDTSARCIAADIKKMTGTNVSVVITDTNGRAFRIGQTGIAIGVANIEPVRDWIGESDLFGNMLQITQEAVADEIASAANILMGEGSGGTPVVIMRGLNIHDTTGSIQQIYRTEEEDIIKKGLRCLQKDN